MNDRWKCPDCKGWVRADIAVHKCDEAKAHTVVIGPYIPDPAPRRFPDHDSTSPWKFPNTTWYAHAS